MSAPTASPLNTIDGALVVQPPDRDAPGLWGASWRALDAVRDPELDEPVTDLSFVVSVGVNGDEVAVDLRLPTYFCAPNFAYLMVSDAHDAVAAVPGVSRVRVRLLEHFASSEINAGVAAGDGFADSFAGLASGELGELRRTFRRKAHTAAQERVAARLLTSGATHEILVATTLGQVPPGPDLDGLRRRRTDLGLDAGAAAPLLVDDEGRPLAVEGLGVRLRFARTTRVSIEGNSSLCRGLLATRYPEPAGAPPG